MSPGYTYINEIQLNLSIVNYNSIKILRGIHNSFIEFTMDFSFNSSKRCNLFISKK